MPADVPSTVIYVLSGGVGASGEGVVLTVLAQFPEATVPVTTVANIRETGQIDEVIVQARDQQALLVHTLVDDEIRTYTIQAAEKAGVPQVDLMGDILTWITRTTGQKPEGQPGLYRKLRKDYFERVEAIEYTMAHDDGKKPEGWPQAEIILAGVSRVGKTPLSLYLSVLGWKVANVPFIPDIPLSPRLFKVEPWRVIGLTMEPGQLLLHRKERQSRLGVKGTSAYIDPNLVYAEVEAARKIFLKNGFRVLDVTDKPIETSADEVVRMVTRAIRSH